jgi:hypothetical protein
MTTNSGEGGSHEFTRIEDHAVRGFSWHGWVFRAVFVMIEGNWLEKDGQQRLIVPTLQ